MDDRINDILKKFNIKRENWHDGIMNGVNCRRSMKYHVEIINKNKDIIIEMSKKVNSLEEIKNMNIYLKE